MVGIYLFGTSDGIVCAWKIAKIFYAIKSCVVTLAFSIPFGRPKCSGNNVIRHNHHHYWCETITLNMNNKMYEPATPNFTVIHMQLHCSRWNEIYSARDWTKYFLETANVTSKMCLHNKHSSSVLFFEIERTQGQYFLFEKVLGCGCFGYRPFVSVEHVRRRIWIESACFHRKLANYVRQTIRKFAMCPNSNFHTEKIGSKTSMHQMHQRMCCVSPSEFIYIFCVPSISDDE